MSSTDLTARTSYQINNVTVPAVLRNDTEMHCATAIFRASGVGARRSPDAYLSSPVGKSYAASVAARAGVPVERLYYFAPPDGWWFTQLLAIDYAGFLDHNFKIMVSMLATEAAKRLYRKSDPMFQEVRERGKIALAETSAVRDRFAPLIRNGKDVKHPYANAALCRAITGKNPSEINAELGLRGKKSHWDEQSTETNALRLLALAFEKPKLEARLEAGSKDPNVMLRIVEDTAKKAAECRKKLEA